MAFIFFRLNRIAERKARLEKLKSSKEQATTPEEKTAIEEELERTRQHLNELSTKLAEAEEADDSDWTSVSSDEPDTEEYTVNLSELNSELNCWLLFTFCLFQIRMYFTFQTPINPVMHLEFLNWQINLFIRVNRRDNGD